MSVSSLYQKCFGRMFTRRSYSLKGELISKILSYLASNVRATAKVIDQTLKSLYFHFYLTYRVGTGTVEKSLYLHFYLTYRVGTGTVGKSLYLHLYLTYRVGTGTVGKSLYLLF